mgnify:CR=1 FL=1
MMMIAIGCSLLVVDQTNRKSAFVTFIVVVELDRSGVDALSYARW